MTTATRRRIPRLLNGTLLFLLAAPRLGSALTLDDRGEMRFGLRAYTDVRVGTEQSGGLIDPVGESDSAGAPLSFPNSPPGHIHQHRYFLELKFDHDVRRLATSGTGMAALFGWLHPDVLKYSLQYRGEGEGLYDYGPKEFSDSFATQKRYHVDLPRTGLTTPILPDDYISPRVNRIHRLARQRHRFFMGYLDIEKGPVFIRVGRQILAWGETDIFRLLDNINPLDNGFGGFLLSLDERRVPVDMLRASYQFGSIGPIHDSFLEAFGALGNRVSTVPGIPIDTAWTPGGLGAPNPALNPVYVLPPADKFRGGARFVFNYRDVTYTLAHYYTYLDNPGVVFNVPKGRPFFPNSIDAVQKVPRVQISGGSLTFPVSSWYSVVRSEAAYFRDEPFNRQGRGNSGDSSGAPGSAAYRRLQAEDNCEGGLDPFVFPGFFDVTRLVAPKGQGYGIRCRMLKRPTFNYALGLDVNRFVRWLNPGQTVLVSTQFFYKHVFNSPGDLVLPVPVFNTSVGDNLFLIGKNSLGCGPLRNGKHVRSCRLEPHLIKLHDDQLLHTLLVTTSYRGGRIVPAVAMFYDWQGALLFQPGVTFVRDPFRLVVDYTRIESNIGAGQISALRDRDNVRFQLEYVF